MSMVCMIVCGSSNAALCCAMVDAMDGALDRSAASATRAAADSFTRASGSAQHPPLERRTAMPLAEAADAAVEVAATEAADADALEAVEEERSGERIVAPLPANAAAAAWPSLLRTEAGRLMSRRSKRKGAENTIPATAHSYEERQGSTANARDKL